MSGIYGIFRQDGGPVDPVWMVEMRAAMAYYGPHGRGAATEGSVALGHLLLEVNPEDAYESQPVAGARGMVVTDARLDNREELLAALEVPSSEAFRVADGKLVSMAFDRWGDELGPRLHGDWALAAWDRREQKLLLARDAFGSATLYYFEGNGLIAFASSVKALLALPGIGHEPDQLRLAQVLVSWQHDAERTAYQQIRRLTWARALTVRPGGATRSWRFWSPEGREPLSWRSDQEYEEAYLEHYSRAVKSCLRGRRPVTATLSGGRDSGSVVALAAPVLGAEGRDLTAYTSVPLHAPDGADDRRTGNEWAAAHQTAVMAGANVRHVALDAGQYGVLQGIEHLLQAHDGPSHAAGNHYWLQAIVEAAAAGGAGTLLTGQMGNATVSWAGNGSALLALLQGRGQTALRLLLSGEANPWRVAKLQVLKPLLQPTRRLIKRMTAPGGHAWTAYSALTPEMAQELRLEARMREANHDPTFLFSPLEDLRMRFFWPMWGIGRGLWSELGAMHAISILDPTTNLALVEFLLRVPDDQFRRNGQGSSLMRRALKERLPAQVLEGRQKGLQAADLGHRILRELPMLRESLDTLEAMPEARQMLDLAKMRACLRALVTEVNPKTTGEVGTILLRGLGVGAFLRSLSAAACDQQSSRGVLVA